MTMTITINLPMIVHFLLVAGIVIYVAGVIAILVADRRSSGGFFTIRLGIKVALLWPIILGLLLIRGR